MNKQYESVGIAHHNGVNCVVQFFVGGDHHDLILSKYAERKLHADHSVYVNIGSVHEYNIVVWVSL